MKTATPQEQFGPLLGELQRAWRTRLDQRLRPLGLSQAKWHALLRLHREGEGISQIRLAELMELEGPTIARLLDRLAREGYIQRRSVPGDRRSKAVHLTAKARRTLTRIEQTVQDVRREILGEVNTAELARCCQTLGRIKARLDQLALV